MLLESVVSRPGESLQSPHQESAVGGAHVGKDAGQGAPAAQGLHYTFMIMLVPLAVSGMLLLRGRRSYPTDVASASVSEENTRAAIDAGEAP